MVRQHRISENNESICVFIFLLILSILNTGLMIAMVHR